MAATATLATTPRSSAPAPGGRSGPRGAGGPTEAARVRRALPAHLRPRHVLAYPLPVEHPSVDPVADRQSGGAVSGFGDAHDAREAQQAAERIRLVIRHPLPPPDAR